MKLKSTEKLYAILMQGLARFNVGVKIKIAKGIFELSTIHTLK